MAEGSWVAAERWEVEESVMLKENLVGAVGPLKLVPLHAPRPLQSSLRALGFGCLRTRAIAPAHP